jgi:4-amino-4-deoxy-L-arabinose transferase-like glycosyltransferase
VSGARGPRGGCLAWILENVRGRLGPRAVGWLLALVTVGVVVANGRQVGFARDEIVYMGHGGTYADWWIGLATLEHGASRAGITKAFGGLGATDGNREHPPLMKTLYGLSHRLLHRGLGVDEVTAYRLPNALLHGLFVLLVFLMALELWGLAEATIAALLAMALPRALFHASLACFDAPIMTLWFATVYAYWRCLDGRRWPWLAGVVFGLALATKHNALLLPFALGLHYAVVGFRAGRWRGLVLHRWRVLVSLAVLGPLTLVALWPWLWFDTIGHLRDWLTFHLKHVHYNFEYLGENWNAPRFPWHVALVTTLLTVPAVTLAAAAVGAAVLIVRRADSPDPGRAPILLLALSAAASIGPFFLGTTPIFGAEKHWMPILPTVCIAAGVGLAWAGRALAAALAAALPPRLRRGAPAALPALAALAVLAAGSETLAAQPYALTWYNALAGGAPGGADLGMNRQFWGVAARGALPALAREAPASRTRPVYTHDAAPAWGLYRRLGLVPPSLPDAGHENHGGIGRSQLAIVIHERHFNRHDYLIWSAYGTVRPIYVLRTDGVPIVTIYRRP